MTTERQSLWERRWQSIENAIDILFDRYERLYEATGSTREQVIMHLLGSLARFGREQFYFFHDGFGEQKVFELAPIPTEDDPTFPFPRYMLGHSIEDHVFRVTVNQIAEDTAVIQRLSEQRIVGKEDERRGRQGGEEIFVSLAVFDRLALANLRLMHAFSGGPASSDYTDDFGAKISAITYYHKSANVRVIPYAPVAMIGIPMTTVGVSDPSDELGVNEDLLVIPHEVGHYLYWNGQYKTDDFEGKFYQYFGSQSFNSPVDQWVEEIFADVAGCWSGGPVTARAMADLLMGSIGERFTTTRGVHPTPALRPYLYMRTLRAMGMDQSADELQERWEAELARRQIYPSRADLYEAYKLVDQIIDILKSQELEEPALRWSRDGTYEELYSQFRTNMQSRVLERISVADLESDLPQPPAWKQIAGRLTKSAQFDDLPENWAGELVKGRYERSTPIKVSPEHWLRILQSDGWTTGGGHHREP